MVKGVIFAGGFGKRLRPITDSIPKTLIEIKRNYTILDKQLLDFKYSDIKEIFLLVGYKHTLIKKRYGGDWNGLKINYLVEKKPMGTLWALRNLAKYVSDDLIVKNGDTVSDFNIREMEKKSISSPFKIVIAVTRMKSPYAIVETENDRIKNFFEKPVLDIKINAGLYYIKKESLLYLNESYSGKEIEKTFFPRMVNLGLAGAYFEDVKWFPVDNFKDLEELRKEYVRRRDTEFGYIKNGREYYVKKGYVARFGTKGTFILLNGKGILENVGLVVMGDKIVLDKKTKYKAEENSLILIEK
ncbi:MAG: nucleotidyltransferase family protein [Thermoplasmata archaeon]